MVKSYYHVTSRYFEIIQTSHVFHPHFFFRKISAGDEIQPLIGDLFKFPFIFLVILCHPKAFKSNISTTYVALALWPMSPMVGPKKSEGLFGWNLPPNDFFLSFKTRQPSGFSLDQGVLEAEIFVQATLTHLLDFLRSEVRGKGRCHSLGKAIGKVDLEFGDCDYKRAKKSWM